MLWGGAPFASITVSLAASPSTSYYQMLTLNGTNRFPFSSSTTSYTFYFTVNGPAAPVPLTSAAA